MRFIWDGWNTAHVTRRMSPHLAELVFTAPDFDATIEHVNTIRSRGYGTVNGVRYRLVFVRTLREDPPGIYIITCYRARRGGARRK